MAETLHGGRLMLKIDCGEFQHDHEVAKLLGAPPGYIGHRETKPLLTQEQLEEVKSPNSDLSIVLFDEIEKAAPALSRLLLGVLDKGVLRLGDNSMANFEKCLIFFTSNIGAPEMMKEMQTSMGFSAPGTSDAGNLNKRIESVGIAAVRKRFSPEFVNRLDAVITYSTLGTESLRQILEHLIAELQEHVNTRLSERCFTIQVSDEVREFLLLKGTSAEYGARELRRTVHKHLTQPLAAVVAQGQLSPGAQVRVSLAPGGERLAFDYDAPVEPEERRHFSVGLVDDNSALLTLLSSAIESAGYKVWTAETVLQAKQLFNAYPPDVMAVDYILPDGNGVEFALSCASQAPEMKMLLMTGGALSSDETTLCVEKNLPLLRKPFLPTDLIARIQETLARTTAAPAKESARSA